MKLSTKDFQNANGELLTVPNKQPRATIRHINVCKLREFPGLLESYANRKIDLTITKIRQINCFQYETHRPVMNHD
jgi:phosphopantetheine adenylyltransferase